MQVSLISPYSDISSMGIRILSSCLKKAGHKTMLIFLPDLDDVFRSDGIPLRYSNKILNQVACLCEKSDFIGISLMTNYFDKGVQLSEYLKARLGVPVIWGGVHPTVKPEEALRYADMVCIGEAEETFLEIVEGKERGDDITYTKGLWVKKDGKIIKNPLRPLNEDLDALPFFDYELDEHYVLKDGVIDKMTPPLLAEFLSFNNLPETKGKPCYQTISARGCPYKCSYCCNNIYHTLYKGQRYLRHRSSQNIIEELRLMKKRYSFIEAVQFSDDTIFANSLDNIKEFCQQYKEVINLPFYCLGHPATITEEKMHCFVDAGLRCIQVGIETGSESTKKLYLRRVSNDRIIKTAQTLNKFANRIYPPIYDFIVDNPYETDEDLSETVKLILSFPKPYELNIFSLVLFPGTELYEKAIKDGLIKDEVEEIYRKRWVDRKRDYFNILFSLLRKRYIPRIFLKVLCSRMAIKLFNKRFPFVVKFIYALNGIFKRLVSVEMRG